MWDSEAEGIKMGVRPLAISAEDWESGGSEQGATDWPAGDGERKAALVAAAGEGEEKGGEVLKKSKEPEAVRSFG